jgi:hypothetical protein
MPGLAVITIRKTTDSLKATLRMAHVSNVRRAPLLARVH